ncbi:PIN domain-containing protein [Thiohalophilus sp.]|uniref:PIN domain-containing protein n=1 Tax=Thiohalophilus sp. TaxID=3028392 RepID=UPI002ACDDABE|nr:PIN domain-containing protein [Thiohalophilus sp.]MDZ7804358.1 PIN domain-containing protein [Thiohalophilus sp.]
MSVRQFVDTNILLYAHDLDAGDKHDRAAGLIRRLWESGEGVLSVQVLQEFYVNITRKIPHPLPLAKARELIGAYSAWQVECPDAQTVLTASEIQERNQLSFWDAMIVAAALQGNADTLLSEDMNHGQVVEGLRIENPLL